MLSRVMAKNVGDVFETHRRLEIVVSEGGHCNPKFQSDGAPLTHNASFRKTMSIDLYCIRTWA